MLKRLSSLSSKFLEGRFHLNSKMEMKTDGCATDISAYVSSWVGPSNQHHLLNYLELLSTNILPSKNTSKKCRGILDQWKRDRFLPERDYVTFVSLLSQFRLSVVCRLSSVCRLSVTLVHPTQGVEAFGKISSPLCTLVIL